MPRTIWGTISANGRKISGEGFAVSRRDKGNYLIDFEPSFSSRPAITSSQFGLEKLSEDTRDNVVFPYLEPGSATALTGDSGGNRTDRQFSFIAIGD